MRRAGAVAALALCLGACGPGPIVRRGALNAPLYATVEGGVERVRGLRFTAAVPVRVLDDAGVAALLDEEIAREFRPGDLERMQAAYARLGLLPAAPPIRPLVEQLYATQMAALYDPRAKALALTTRGLRQGGLGVRLLAAVSGRDLVGEMLVAHELVHALQDQHYGIPTEAEPVVDAHGDAVIARRALLEGDATIAGFAYLQGRPLDADMLTAIAGELDRLPDELRAQYPEIPEALRAQLAFEYDAGARFVAAALARGGWPAVDAAHRDPPASTEQVLHPERYFERRDPPRAVVLGGTADLERAGWMRTVEDTLGELDTGTLARLHLDPARARLVAEGWGGDRLRALARGDDVAIVWMTAWDSERDADEFAAAAPTMVSGALVERRADRVLVLVGAAAPLAGRVWAETTVSR
jgi:hypothetical protein